jgi:hypothetical protein
MDVWSFVVPVVVELLSVVMTTSAMSPDADRAFVVVVSVIAVAPLTPLTPSVPTEVIAIG